jgi:hypothetical protein
MENNAEYCLCVTIILHTSTLCHIKEIIQIYLNTYDIFHIKKYTTLASKGTVKEVKQTELNLLKKTVTP